MSSEKAIRDFWTSNGAKQFGSDPDANLSQSDEHTRMLSGLPKRSHPRKTGLRTPVPSDVLTEIISLLDESELIRCLRVSKNVHRLAVPYLYPKLYSTLSIDLSAPINPISINGTPITSIWNRSQTLTIPKFLLPAGETKLAFVSRIVDADPLPNRFDYTTHLTFTSHCRSNCEKIPPLIMPNLETLRVKPALDERNLDLCRYHNSSDDPDKYPYPSTISCCPAIVNLRPKRLILGGMCTALDGSLLGLWTATHPFPPFITNVTILISMLRKSDIDFTTRPSILDIIQSDAVNMVVVTSLGLLGWKPLSRKRNEITGEYFSEAKQMDASEVTRIILCAVNSSDNSIEIVGWPLADGPHGKSLGIAARAAILRATKGCLREYGYSEERVDSSLNSVSFTFEGDFEDREEWYSPIKTEWTRKELKRKVRGVKPKPKVSREKAVEGEYLWTTASWTTRMISLVLDGIMLAVVGAVCWKLTPILWRVVRPTLGWTFRPITSGASGILDLCWQICCWTFPIPIGYMVYRLVGGSGSSA